MRKFAIVIALSAFSWFATATALPTVAQPAAPQNGLESRALSVLDRAVEFYRQQQSFSIKGRETLIWTKYK